MRMRLLRVIGFAAISWALPLHAEVLSVNAQTSTLSFAGEHAGRAFDGQFTVWQAELVLPPLDNPSITASFDLSSAQTGNAMYDETLPEQDWFNVKEHPTGLFTSKSVSQQNADIAVEGQLTLRGQSHPVSFVLKPTTSGWTAEFSIDRLQFGIGMESDPDAEWVSKDIRLNLVLNR